MTETIIHHLKTHLLLSWDMLEKLITACPDNLWDKKHGGFIFWQQVLHAFTGTSFWTRQSNGTFTEPFQDRQVFPELEQDAIGRVSKAEMGQLAAQVRGQLENFLAGRGDNWLLEPSPIFDKIKNIDVIAGQIRHIQYHVGHCDAILREQQVAAVEWRDYYGE